jgi:hypothetical protein
VALAAVDQALLELMPNTSWNLLDAMLQRRSLGRGDSTAQMEIIGRRHYGRKAVPAGGGGGKKRRARAAGHPAAVEPGRGAGRQRPGRGDGAAE